MTLTGTENTAGASVLFREFDVVYFDLDGVLYRGKQSVPGAGETVSELVAHAYCLSESFRSTLWTHGDNHDFSTVRFNEL